MASYETLSTGGPINGIVVEDVLDLGIELLIDTDTAWSMTVLCVGRSRRGRNRDLRVGTAGHSRAWACTAEGWVASRNSGVTDPAGGVTSYSYDPAGRLVGESRPDAEISLGYSVEGWRNHMVDPSGTTSWDQDPAGRVTEVTSAAGTIAYSYDDAGQLTAMSGPMGSVAYTYDPAGRVATLTNDLGTTSYSWTPGGRQALIERPNGTLTANSHDPAGRLVGVDHVGPDGTIASFGYTLDPAGNRIGVDTLAGSETYTLDELNRLISASYADGTSETFAYDPAAGGQTFGVVMGRGQWGSTRPLELAWCHEH